MFSCSNSPPAAKLLGQPRCPAEFPGYTRTQLFSSTFLVLSPPPDSLEASHYFGNGTISQEKSALLAATMRFRTPAPRFASSAR
ncbi:hypothetical protein SBA4_3090020 [Candidatus Sulfopaludibacter sp. SbA4]|nr:hypothetical protein SBA4_3090020 [Candidatus Sulfopaludibacter sp. SbA4]